MLDAAAIILTMFSDATRRRASAAEMRIYAQQVRVMRREARCDSAPSRPTTRRASAAKSGENR